MADIGQIDMGEMMREYGEEEVARLLNEIMENNAMMLKLQKQIVELQEVEENKRRWIEINEKEKEEQRRVDEEWRKIEIIKRREEKKAEKEWRYQEMRERKREENRQRVMEERKCFGCRGFGYMASHCRNGEKEELVLVASNRFEVLKVRVIQRGEEKAKREVRRRKNC